MKFRVPAPTLELVDRTLDKRARANHHLRAGIDRRSDLGIDVGLRDALDLL